MRENLSLVGTHSTPSVTSKKIKRFLTQESLPLPTRSLPESLPRQAHTSVGRWAAPLRTPYTPPQVQHPPGHQTRSPDISLAHGASGGMGHIRDHGFPAWSPYESVRRPQKSHFPPFHCARRGSLPHIPATLPRAAGTGWAGGRCAPSPQEQITGGDYFFCFKLRGK